MQGLAGTDVKTIINKLLVLAENGTLYDLITAIKIIVKKRMTDVFHMNADLVGAAGFQHTLHQRNIIEPLNHLVVRDGFLAMISFRIGFKQFTVTQVAAHMRYDGPAVPLHITPDKRQVLTLNGVIKKLLREVPHGLIGFCQHQQATRIFINAVYQSEPG